MGDPINWLLTVELIAIVIGASAFLFYWNRLIAAVFAFLIRLYTWRAHNAYISIGSLQISPLAGRLSWKDLEYHSSNLSVRALNGHITWRYWKLRVRQEGDAESSNLKRSVSPTYDLARGRLTQDRPTAMPYQRICSRCRGLRLQPNSSI